MKNTSARAIAAAGLALLAISPALACHRDYPDLESLEKYSAIFLGNVTGIHLDDYENRLLGQPDGLVAGTEFTIVDGSGAVTVDVVILSSFRGKPPHSIAVRLVGCTAPLPQLKQSAVFFLLPDGTSAVTIWDSNDAFAPTLSRLEKSKHDS